MTTAVTVLPVLPEDVVTDLEDRVRLAVTGGYDSADELVAGLIELVEYDPATEDGVARNRDEVVAAIQRMVDRRMAEHAAAEGLFPSTTDCDRLTAAFGRLEADGVLAREDVGYTQSDVRDEMWELVDRTRAEERSPRGWVAFHRQDVERAVDSGVLYISFASVSDDDDGFRAIGAEVVAALTDVGLTVDWDGDPNRRVELVGLRWQKRRRRSNPRRAR
jgi:hypothetical protein